MRQEEKLHVVYDATKYQYTVTSSLSRGQTDLKM